MAWELSSQLIRMGITTLVSHQALTVDPSFESVVPFGTRMGMGGLVSLYEVCGAQKEERWGCQGAMCRWTI